MITIIAKNEHHGTEAVFHVGPDLVVSPLRVESLGRQLVTGPGYYSFRFTTPEGRPYTATPLFRGGYKLELAQ